MAGYVKLFRSIDQWEWYQDTNTKSIFIHCLIRANHKSKKWKGKVIEPGMFVTSYSKLSDELNLTISQIRVGISHLKMTGEIAHQMTNKFSIITVTKWGDYQVLTYEDDTQNNKQERTQIATNKNDKNIKKNKNNTNTGFSIPLLDDVVSYIRENNFNVDANSFMDYYTSTGWLISGKTKMKDWKSTIRNWDRRNANKKNDNKKQERPEKSYGVTI